MLFTTSGLGLRAWTAEFSGISNMCHGLGVQELQVPARRAWSGQRMYNECPAPSPTPSPAPSPVWATALAKGEVKFCGQGKD